MFKLWNSFINICFTTDILTRLQLLNWKYGKFKKFVKSTLHNFQNLGDLQTWYPFNYNISDLETRILSGDINLNTESKEKRYIKEKRYFISDYVHTTIQNQGLSTFLTTENNPKINLKQNTNNKKTNSKPINQSNSPKSQ